MTTNKTPGLPQRTLTHLERLEAESIQVMR